MIEKLGWFSSLSVTAAGLLVKKSPGFLTEGTLTVNVLLSTTLSTSKIPLNPFLSVAAVLLELETLLSLTFAPEDNLWGISEVTVAIPEVELYSTSWII